MRLGNLTGYFHRVKAIMRKSLRLSFVGMSTPLDLATRQGNPKESSQVFETWLCGHVKTTRLGSYNLAQKSSWCCIGLAMSSQPSLKTWQLDNLTIKYPATTINEPPQAVSRMELSFRNGLRSVIKRDGESDFPTTRRLKR